MIFDKTITRIFQFLLVLFFVLTASSAVLGFLKVYSPISEISVSVLLTGCLLFFLWKQGKDKADPTPSKIPAWLSAVLFGCGIAILCTLIIYPVLRWPASHVGDWFPWDAGLYHFPKAVELYRSGSIWDLSIAYGDYPFGYESLLSFGLLLTGDLTLFGPIHALIVLFFICGFWVLARRITKLDGGLLMLLIAVFILSDRLFQFMNLWRVFTLDIYTVGKNDLLVTASLLAALYYFYQVQERYESGILGFALASGLAASIKPNTLYVLFPLWLFLFIRNYRERLGSLAAHALLLIPGLLWLVRNLIVLGAPVSADAARLSAWSIVSNLTNPYFYQNIPKNLLLVVGLVALEVVLAFKNNKAHFWNAVVAVVLLAAFISTPVTAYFGDTNTIPSINWRFGEALLAFLGILVLNDLAILGRSFKMKKALPRAAAALLAGTALAGSTFFIYQQRESMQAVPQNVIILHDQFREPVGVQGYRSAYDYIQKNVHDAVVWVENGLPFYLYDAGFTNTVSRESQADYVVGFRKDWFGEGEMDYPALIEKLLASQTYEIVYQDTQGIVLHQK
ncbi:MAG: hypothetical protein C4545_05260 [Anaerolineaceae bacterium]|jgi:hypothetical protein|nr:MAG: hypothetical protein C4545_05260 [Anaerolineaceae bacterium]